MRCIVFGLEIDLYRSRVLGLCALGPTDQGCKETPHAAEVLEAMCDAYAVPSGDINAVGEGSWLLWKSICMDPTINNAHMVRWGQ